MIMAKIALGSSSEALQPDCIKALVVEFICTFLFVFAGVGSAMATAADDKMSGKNDEVVGLLFVAIAHALVVAVMISAGLKISGGHLNPAVTLGLCVGGHITVVRSILYWIDQCLASVAACALLKYLTGGMMTPVHTLAAGIDSVQGVTMEIVLTFSLLFTVYATIVDDTTAKEEGGRSFQGPLLTGLVVGANIMAGGSFSGASMNPARSFGPALITGIWTDHWVYWVGPLIGGGLAGIIYDNCFFIVRSNNYVVVLPRDEEENNN